MPHRAFRVTYVVVLDGPDIDEPTLSGPFGSHSDAEHFAAAFCKTSERVTDCQVRALIPPIFLCDESIADEAEEAG